MIDLIDFSCGYGDRMIVSGCTLTLQNGVLTGLLGANGCGKTTLFKGICHRIPTRGTCFVDGLPHTAPPARLAKRLSYIPQRSGMTLSCSALDAVLMGAHVHTPLLSDYTPAQRRHAEELLRQFLTVSPDTDFLALSAGQQQLVILARCLMQGADNLLLDEPDSALDFSNKHRVLSEIRSVSRAGKCVLLCLHDPNIALQYCDRLLFMQDGVIFEDLAPGTAAPARLDAAFRTLYGDVRVVRLQDQLFLLREQTDL